MYRIFDRSFSFHLLCLRKSWTDGRTPWARQLPNTEILVVNEKGQRCLAGEIGELVHRGPTFSGLLGKAGTAQARSLNP